MKVQRESEISLFAKRIIFLTSH